VLHVHIFSLSKDMAICVALSLSSHASIDGVSLAVCAVSKDLVAFSSPVGGVCACTSWHKNAHPSAVVHRDKDILDIVTFVSESTLHTTGGFADHSIPPGCSLCKDLSNIAVIVP
jgi:hypothetical protein